MMLNYVQKKFEEARRDWATDGGWWNYLRLVFWEWVYRRQKVPVKGGVK